MPSTVLVIGASGEVGEGIVGALLASGRRVVGAGRSRTGLDALAARLGHPDALSCITGSLEGDAAAEALAVSAGGISAVVVSVNSLREPSRLAEIDSTAMGELLKGDLLSHYAGIRCFLPRLPADGAFIGIGGGSADFILDGGVYMSMAQAALRNLYRGHAHERGEDRPALRELIVASVIAGRKHGDNVDPRWVTPLEVGEQVVAMIESPDKFSGPIWRISRRDASGRPVVSSEGGGGARVLPL